MLLSGFFLPKVGSATEAHASGPFLFFDACNFIHFFIYSFIKKLFQKKDLFYPSFLGGEN